MMNPRKWKDSTVSTGEPCTVPSEIHNCLSPVALSAPDGQSPPLRTLILTRDEPNEDGVIYKLQERDGLMTASSAVDI